MDTNHPVGLDFSTRIVGIDSKTGGILHEEGHHRSRKRNLYCVEDGPPSASPRYYQLSPVPVITRKGGTLFKSLIYMSCREYERSSLYIHLLIDLEPIQCASSK